MTPPAKKAAIPALKDLMENKKEDEKTNPSGIDHTDLKKDGDNPPEIDDTAVANRSVGPDNDKDNVLVDVEDSTTFDRDEDYVDDGDEDKSDTWNTSPSVVSLKTDKTPAELAAETPDETAKRYGVDTTITDEDADNPNVQVYRDTIVNQVPSGTHLHPDIAKDLLNRGIAEQTTDNAQVKRTITETYAFAPDADHNDKF